MKYIEELIISLLGFIGIEVSKLALGELFVVIVVAFVGWGILSVILLIPLRFFIDFDEKPNSTIDFIEKILVVFAFILSFAGSFYLWSIGF